MRRSGVLLHISSLDSPGGIGTLGAAAFRFVDFLAESGQTFWQTLPIGPTGIYDSPYQSFSSFAGNPYFIDLELLIKDGLLSETECEELFDLGGETVDYSIQYEKRFPLLFLAAERGLLNPAPDFRRFLRGNLFWLSDYSLFMALKGRAPDLSFSEWEKPIRTRERAALAKAKSELKKEMEKWMYLQFLFFCQWRRLKEYANERRVLLIGDLPIYVSPDSADLWANPHLFQVDGECRLLKQAGVPPDYFSEEGQLWGNPLYDWDVHKKSGYDWWMLRLSFIASLFDVVRIDHFRGFADYYSIDAEATDAKKGLFHVGPGMDFFRTLKARLPAISLIAEDLGLLSEEAKALRVDSELPGMAVLQFAFSRDSISEYMPHRLDTNTVAYLGTHDNDTFWGWLNSGPPEETSYALEYMRLSANEGFSKGAVKMLFSTPADTAIVQMQDILGLGSEARMNTPGTLGENWKWRLDGNYLTKDLINELYETTAAYDRLPRDGEL